MLSVRALAAELNEQKNIHVWNSKGGHWIAIHSVGDLVNDGSSMSIEFSDSISGKRQTGTVFFNESRKASVPMQFDVDNTSNARWTWVTNQKTLELLSPQMPLGTKRVDWHQRTFIAVRYLIYKP